MELDTCNSYACSQLLKGVVVLFVVFSNDNAHHVNTPVETIDHFCTSSEFAARFSKMAISKSEWKLIRQMCNILQLLHDVSQLVSTQTNTMIGMVIPAFNDLFDFLEEQEENETNHQIIQTAATQGLTVLCKYYAKTDSRPLYFAAVCKFHSY